MKLTKKSAGSVGVHVWKSDGDTVDVPDALGLELLGLAPGEYEHVPDDEPRKPARRSKTDTE